MGKKKSRKTRGAASSKTTANNNADTPSQLQHLKLDPRGDGMYSGTFRWLETKQFPCLPPFPRPTETENDEKPPIDLSGGWKEYLSSRSGGSSGQDLVATAMQDPSMLDALSFPVTFLHATTLLSLCKGPELHVLVIGASQKAEQRVWRITDYWNEIAAFYSTFNVTLVFIGPEVDEHDETRKPGLPSNMKLQCFRGTIGDFLDSHLSSHCTPDTSVAVGYNTGFGNFVESERHELLFSWLPDLNRIAASGIPAVFTCANDYADMNGEFAVQSRVVGAKMLLLPKQNPFSAASHLHEEGQRDTAWSRGSSFMYAICGIDKARHVDIKPGDINLLQKRLDSGMDLHLQDALGRHFYKGMVLTKEQASRCKALIGGSARAPQNAKPSSSQTDKLETPRLELMPGQHDDEVIAAVFVPKIQDASEQIAVDISSSILTVFVPGKYLLRATLPFRVDDDGPAAQAQLTLPFLRILLRKK